MGRHRRGLLFATSVVFAATVAPATGCADVLGLEDRTLESASPEGGAQEGSTAQADAGPHSPATDPPLRDAGTTLPDDGGATPEAGTDAAVAPAACDHVSTVVYAHSDGSYGWKYSTSKSPPAGYFYQGEMFRLASAPFAGATKLPLYVISNASNGDSSLSTSAGEAQNGYVIEGGGPLGDVYKDAVAGAVRVNRFHRETPVSRHRVFFAGDVTGDWQQETNHFYACPYP